MVNCVSLVYFSATKTTQKNLRAIAEGRMTLDADRKIHIQPLG